ncbi:hypothetical protein U0B34_25865, partial [Escherichia coli]|nr:hypothetical protein [Escherichia coli]
RPRRECLLPSGGKRHPFSGAGIMKNWRNDAVAWLLMQATAMEYGEWNNAAVIAVIIMVTAAICTLLIATLITPFATRKGEVK